MSAYPRGTDLLAAIACYAIVLVGFALVVLLRFAEYQSPSTWSAAIVRALTFLTGIEP